MRALILAATLVFAGVSVAADRQLVMTPTVKPPTGEKRLALVIGNAAYANSPLRNPVNDARAIAKALAGTGFNVTVLEDATQSAMTRAIRQFGDELTAGGVGLFYYAGHGMQVRGKNFLVPVNADIQREDEIEFNAVDASFIVAKMDTAKNGLNVLILDACRNNPFQRSFRSVGQGLAQMDAPSGTLVAFATAPGQVAADGDGQNGLYTKHLLANLAKPGLPIEQLFKEVRNGVARETGERQIPWESSSLRGNFFFVAPDPSQSPEAQKAAMDRAIAEAVKREQDRVAAEQREQQRKIDETIRQLLAKQRAEIEEEMKRRGEQIAPAAKPAPVPVAPAPVAPAPAQVPIVAAVQPTPAVQPRPPESVQPAILASMAPTLAGTGIDDPRYPRLGDWWQYRYVDTYGRKKTTMRFEVVGVSKEGILESGGFENSEPIPRAHSAAAVVRFDEEWSFAPYLLSFAPPKKDEQWHNIPYRYSLCAFGGAICRFDGKAGGTEKISTPAGTFDAVKIVVEMNASALPGSGSRNPMGNRIWRQMTFWYADAAKRVVKTRVRTLNGDILDSDYDLELVSYKLN